MACYPFGTVNTTLQTYVLFGWESTWYFMTYLSLQRRLSFILKHSFDYHCLSFNPYTFSCWYFYLNLITWSSIIISSVCRPIKITMLCACLHEPSIAGGATKVFKLFHFGCITTVILWSEDQDYKQPNCITCDGEVMSGFEPVVLSLLLHFISGYEPRPSLLRGQESNLLSLGYEPNV